MACTAQYSTCILWTRFYSVKYRQLHFTLYTIAQYRHYIMYNIVQYRYTIYCTTQYSTGTLYTVQHSTEQVQCSYKFLNCTWSLLSSPSSIYIPVPCVPTTRLCLKNYSFKRCIYIFAFDPFKSKHVNVSGIQHFLAQLQGLELRKENLNAAIIYLSGIENKITIKSCSIRSWDG